LGEVSRTDGDQDDFVFPGRSLEQPLSNMAMLKLLERMDRSDLTVHGFRSTFRDWAAEKTKFPNEVIEMALAHSVGDKVEAAYRRGDLFEKRQVLMRTWTDYCLQIESGDNVIQLQNALIG
jgi:integrase